MKYITKKDILTIDQDDDYYYVYCHDDNNFIINLTPTNDVVKEVNKYIDSENKKERELKLERILKDELL